MQAFILPMRTWKEQQMNSNVQCHQSKAYDQSSYPYGGSGETSESFPILHRIVRTASQRRD